MIGNVFEKKDVILIQTLGIYAELINRAISTSNLQTSDFFNNIIISEKEQKKRNKAYLDLQNFLNNCTDETLNMFVTVTYIGSSENAHDFDDINRQKLYKILYNKHLNDVNFHVQILLGKQKNLKKFLDIGLKILNPYIIV